jgi:integrase
MSKTPKFQTKYPGVRYTKHKTRKHGKGPDKYFTIRYMGWKEVINEETKKYEMKYKQIEDGVGWASKGMTDKEANEILSELKKAKRLGEGPTTLSEKRSLRSQKKLANLKENIRKRKENTTFNQIWKKYFPIQQSNVSERSWKREESLFRLWISPVIINMPMKNVTEINIQKIRKNMENAGLSVRSICYAYDVIRQVYNFANRNNLIDVPSPTKGIKKPKKDNKRYRFLTSNEADLLLNNLKIKYPLIHEISLISLNCGLRAGEIFALTWSNIDLENGRLIATDTKTKENRFPLMTDEVKQIFQNKERGSPNELVFPSRNSKERKAISKSFMRTVKKLGLNEGITDSRNKVVFHTLRHTYASWLVQDGLSLYEVSKLLGHSTITMTERYSHLAPQNYEKSVKIIEKKSRKSKKPKRLNLQIKK